jgi:hypothetical protein
MPHPVEAVLNWTIAIMVVCAPRAASCFRVRPAEEGPTRVLAVAGA